MELWGVVVGAGVAGVFTVVGHSYNRRTEHRQWLRSEKKEAYLNFFDAYRSLIYYCSNRPSAPLATDPGVEPLQVAMRPTAIRLVAPKEIGELAEKVYGRAMFLSISMSLSDFQNPHVVKSRNLAEKLIADMEVLCHRDLQKP